MCVCGGSKIEGSIFSFRLFVNSRRIFEGSMRTRQSWITEGLIGDRTEDSVSNRFKFVSNRNGQKPQTYLL